MQLKSFGGLKPGDILECTESFGINLRKGRKYTIDTVSLHSANFVGVAYKNLIPDWFVDPNAKPFKGCTIRD